MELEGVGIAAGTEAAAGTGDLLAATGFSLSGFFDCGEGEGDFDRENKPSMRLRREGCVMMCENSTCQPWAGERRTLEPSSEAREEVMFTSK